ncbi:MAG: electron transfer flavoprotein subunit alpha/FixB family protein [Candidatus Portiera sp.]|nr:electron transfer flavoprotein subunit alpha/FixB family protein [Portiera sp.]
MNSIPRIDPHAANRGFLAASGRKRIARGRDLAEGEAFTASQQSAQHQLPQIVIKDPKEFVLVCLHSREGTLSNLDREVLYVGRVLAGRRTDCALTVIVFGDLEIDMRQHGADRVIILKDDRYTGYNQEEKLSALEHLIDKLKPQNILFGESAEGDGDLARRLAVRQNMSIAPGVIELDDNKVRRFCDGGWQQGTHELTDILILNSGTAEADFDFETQALMENKLAQIPTKASTKEPANASKVLQEMMRSLSANEVPLEEANFILSGGNGVKDFDKLLRLAKAIGASVGGSRVVVDDGKLPRECQVGATGKTVVASVYIAVGISGAVQHLQGIKDCRYVVAVNLDESCDMVKRADLSLICDAEEWMDSMLELLGEESRKSA